MQLKTLFRSSVRDEDLAGAREATYANWRQASDGVADAYRGWAIAPCGERFLAHAAYLAALEREEHAAWAYQELVEQSRSAADARVSC